MMMPPVVGPLNPIADAPKLGRQVLAHVFNEEDGGGLADTQLSTELVAR